MGTSQVLGASMKKGKFFVRGIRMFKELAALFINLKMEILPMKKHKPLVRCMRLLQFWGPFFEREMLFKLLFCFPQKQGSPGSSVG